MAISWKLSCYSLGVLLFSQFVCSKKWVLSMALIVSLKYQFLQLYFWQEQESSQLNDAKCRGVEVRCS